MWAITDVTDTETKRLGNHVRQMKQMAGTIAEVNPAKAAVGLNTSTLTAMTRSMANQAAVLTAASNTIFPTSASLIGSTSMKGSPSSTSATAQGSSLVTKNINVTVNNPVAERASDTTARKLRQLSDMGAL
jgi:hypothetical protein